MKTSTVKQLFEQHTSSYSTIQEQILQIEKEKLALMTEKFELKKKTHQEHTELLLSLVEKMNELTNIIRSIVPEYLE